jgi:RNA polymerase sigma-70 factor (ECF subfamily)
LAAVLSGYWSGAPASAELEAALADLVARAQAWPRRPVVAERFIAWVAARLGAPDLAAIRAACAADLHLALACAERDSGALADFEAALAAVRPAIAALGAGDADEVLQRLRVQMLVGEQPGLLAYSGRGELRAWLRVVAVREAVRVLGERGRSQAIDDTRLLEAMLPAIDAEREVISSELRSQFRAAFEEGIRAIAPLDRLLLRQHSVDDLSIDQIGALHGVHRATAARWIESARVELALATERALQRRLKGTAEEVRSLLRLIASRMDASVHRLLAD